MNKIPAINRARGYFLYTSDGRRYLDMDLDGARLLMGHRQSGFAQAVKNAVDKGLFAPYPSVFEYRFKQALQSIFGKEMHIYFAKKADKLPSELPLWRPFEDFDGLDAFIPILPIPSAFAPCVVVSRGKLDIAETEVSPVILAGAVRAVYNLKNFLDAADYSLWKDAPIIDALEKHWKVRLPYLYPCVSEESYGRLFEKCLEGGILISQDYEVPSVVPSQISGGTLKKLLEVLI